MITIALTMGLGNFIFQYALGKSLSSRGYDVQYRFLHHPSAHTPPNSPERHSLTPYNIQLPVAQEPFTFSSTNEPRFSFCPETYDPPENAYLVGNWQSEKYFSNIETEIRETLTLKNISKDVQETADRIKDGCFIHLRFGDYMTPKNIEYHGRGGGLNYYNVAIDCVRAAHPNIKFYLFSDEPKRAKEMFPQFECISGKFTQHEDLFLMSKCNHGIGANSSFSWWANWLGDYPGRICIFPKQWFNQANLDTKDLIPDRWVTL